MRLELDYNKNYRIPQSQATRFHTLKHNRIKPAFNRAAISNLSATDQLRFERYGQGPARTIPYHTIHQAIEAQCLQHGDLIAARHLDQQISYSELNRQANHLAAHLNRIGIGRGDNVGLFVERSIPMLVGILGILKTGAAYVPQDPKVTPAPMQSRVIESAGLRVILTLSHLQDRIPDQSDKTILALDTLTTLSGNTVANLHLPRAPVADSDNCFVLFTSGTTGNPNGVQVTHSNVCNLLLSRPGDLGIKPGDKVAQLLNIAFDMAAWEILGCLSHGATLIIRDRDFTAAASKSNIIIATPSILGRVDADACTEAKTVAVAGEPCPRPLAETWAKKCRFYNSCGPTETTIINTAQHFQSHSRHLTIGKPTPNNTIYILDENLQPLPIGEVGEIWAGGQGISSGYINNQQLTDDRYKHDPFLNDGRMMFRTRDLGRWNEQGELEYLGRTDDQVKVRGFRVELDSVSGVLESVPGCQQAVTLKLDKDNLVAYVRPATVNISQCEQAIKAALPYYCMPAKILSLDKLPVTSRGKIDKRLLLSDSFLEPGKSTQSSEGAAS
ncbi:amino acid adenylation domain-containing protein [Spongorhabdus nitratireducens]